MFMFMFWMRHGAYVYVYDGGLRPFWLVARVMMFMNIWMSLPCTGGAIVGFTSISQRD